MDKRKTGSRLIDCRARVLREYPFFGKLLMPLKLGLAKCGTAFTDMERIVFDPDFAARLSDDELMYVMLHELLHCVLKHCTRGKGKKNYIYNLACDIVVNSLILEMLDLDKLIIDGAELCHIAPCGIEGREMTADEIYKQLLKIDLPDDDSLIFGKALDNHDVWESIGEIGYAEDVWTRRVIKASESCGRGSGNIPSFMKRHLVEIERESRTNWRQILNDFIRYESFDYDFLRPDKRYLPNFIMPSFCNCTSDGRVEKLWTLIDTSGSVSDEAVALAYNEIEQATCQVGGLSGMLSFFDSKVSEPVEFETVDDIRQIEPIGGGGTCFHAIFRKLRELVEEDEAPRAIVIITDGYATVPDESEALNIPVIWVIVGSDVQPPWGTVVHVDV